MRRNQRASNFGRDAAFLDDERLYLAQMLLRALAAAVCWLIYAASSVQSNPSPPFTPMLVLGGFLLPAVVASARRWVYRVCYRRSIIIGACVSTTT